MHLVISIFMLTVVGAMGSRNAILGEMLGLAVIKTKLINKYVVTHCLVNPCKPGVLSVGHRQTVKTQIRCHKMWHLIKVFTICLQYFLSKFE